MFRIAKKGVSNLSQRSLSSAANNSTLHAPRITTSSSLFARGVTAVYLTHDIPSKLATISTAISLWKTQKIPLIDWDADKDVYAYLHYGVANVSEIPTSQNTKYNGVTSLSTSPDRVSWMYPARPAGRPELVNNVPNHKLLKVPLDMFIMHALAHVELNAVDMYMDTVIRFACSPPVDVAVPNPFDGDHSCPVLPEDFVNDMLNIVDDEARHFLMVDDHLRELSELHGRDLRYGSIPGVNNLWHLGVSTRHCIAERLAVIPLSQEARGLDAASRFAERLYAVPNHAAARIVEQIGEEEENHVRLGLKWFAWVSWRQGLVPHADLPAPSVPEYVKLGVFERYDTKGVERRHDGGKAKQDWKARVAELNGTGNGNGTDQPSTSATNETDLQTMYYYDKNDDNAVTDGHMRALGQHWQSKVSIHFPDGLYPPFNRLARYAAGMSEDWYMPLMNKKVFVDECFYSVPPSAPMNSNIRKKYKALTSHLQSRRDNGDAT